MKYQHTTAKQEGGDDGYCYVVRDKHTGKKIVEGLTRAELPYYRDLYEKAMTKKKESDNESN